MVEYQILDKNLSLVLTTKVTIITDQMVALKARITILVVLLVFNLGIQDKMDLVYGLGILRQVYYGNWVPDMQQNGSYNC